MNKRKNLVALDGVDSGASTGCAIADEEAFDTSDAEQMEEAELHGRRGAGGIGSDDGALPRLCAAG